MVIVISYNAMHTIPRDRFAIKHYKIYRIVHYYRR